MKKLVEHLHSHRQEQMGLGFRVPEHYEAPHSDSLKQMTSLDASLSTQGTAGCACSFLDGNLYKKRCSELHPRDLPTLLMGPPTTPSTTPARFPIKKKLFGDN